MNKYMHIPVENPENLTCQVTLLFVLFCIGFWMLERASVLLLFCPDTTVTTVLESNFVQKTCHKRCGTRSKKRNKWSRLRHGVVKSMYRNKYAYIYIHTWFYRVHLCMLYYMYIRIYIYVKKGQKSMCSFLTIFYPKNI
jgi:hypothetical protein